MVTAQHPITRSPLPRRYFQEHVQHVPPGQTVEISVHCDSGVFDWLFAWAQGSGGPTTTAAGISSGLTARPMLTAGIALQVLISSSFLKVRRRAPLSHQAPP